MIRGWPAALLMAALGCPGPSVDSALAPAIPKPEHPRPDWRRDAWVNLNGPWAFDHDPDDLGVEQAWYAQPGILSQEILVPFPFESPASGLGEPFPDDGSAAHAMTDPTFQGVSWYQRSFTAPRWDLDRTFLIFGAVDWRATVWLNGIELGSHEGGWLPFELELTDAMHPGLNQLTVRIEDWAEDEPDILNGKQGGSWYTRSSGIWQTVYLEGRPQAYLAGAWFHPDWRTGRVELAFELSQGGDEPISVEIEDPRGGTATWEASIGDAASFDLTALFPQHDGPALWSPANPLLYEVTVGRGEDRVHSAFGVRGLGLDWAPGHGPHDGVPVEDQFQVFTLNGEPIYLRGVLDQNYNPEGLLTYPDEDALVADLEAARDLGFNLLRVHAMHPEPRKLWHADRMGLLVMQDIPTPYAFLDNVPGTPYREHWRRDLEDAWRRDHNHPSLVSWVLFNEAWGLTEPDDICSDDELQAWVLDSLAFARGLDPSRWIEDESTTDVVTGVYDHLDPDFTSWHFYSDDWQAIDEHLEQVLAGSTIGGDHLYCDGFEHQGQPLLLSEFAGAGCYETVGLEGPEIGQHFTGWISAIRARPRIAGYVFTQLTDVEWERNGLLGYDRQAKEHGLTGLDNILGVNQADAVVIEGVPGQALPSGDAVQVEISFARGGDGSPMAAEAVTLGWAHLPLGEDGGVLNGLLGEGRLDLEAGWGLHPAGVITLEGTGQDSLLLVLAGIDGELVAAGWRRYPAP